MDNLKAWSQLDRYSFFNIDSLICYQFRHSKFNQLDCLGVHQSIVQPMRLHSSFQQDSQGIMLDQLHRKEILALHHVLPLRINSWFYFWKLLGEVILVKTVQWLYVMCATCSIIMFIRLTISNGRWIPLNAHMRSFLIAQLVDMGRFIYPRNPKRANPVNM